MTVFLGFLVLVAIGLELVALFDGLKHVRFDCDIAKQQAEPGEEIPVHVRVTNTGIFPITDLRTQVYFPVHTQFEADAHVQENRLNKTLLLPFHVWGRQQVTQTVPVRFEKRGIHFFTGAALYRGDFLGLYQVPGEHTTNHELLIYPKLLENDRLSEALGSFCGDMIAQRHLIQDPIFTLGLREYTGREPMKTISWSQTARRGQLMTREFDFTRDFSCTVLLASDDLHPKQVNLLDTGCAIVRTICRDLTDRGVNVDFYTNVARLSWKRDSRRVWNCTVGTDRTAELLECLARLYVSTRCSAEELASTAARAAGMGTAFVLVATQHNEHMERAVQILREKSGMQVMLLVAEDYEEA